MTTARNILIVLTIFSICISGCNKDKPEKTDGDISTDTQSTDISKDPNAYYDGCVSCTLALESKGLFIKQIYVKATFKNETYYPIPIEKRHVFISMDGKANVMEWATFEVYRDGEEVRYIGITYKRAPSKFPQDYYILPSHATYVALMNLNKYYDISKSGKYTIQYWASNSLTSIFKESYGFVIESDTVEFDKNQKMASADYNVLIDDVIKLLKEDKLEYPPPLLVSHAALDLSKYPLIKTGKPTLDAIRKKFSELTDEKIKAYFLLSMFYIGEGEVNRDALLVLRNESDEGLCRIASHGLCLYGGEENLPDLVNLLQDEGPRSLYVLSPIEHIAHVFPPIEKLMNLSEEESFEKRKKYILEWWENKGSK